jgi:polyisoprenoid-binding protein YceI
MSLIIKGLLLIIFALSATFSKPSVYEVSDGEAVLIVAGTSSLHDWEMKLDKFDCEVAFTNEGFTMKSIDQVKFSCKASDIKSGNKIMDRKTYDALKADREPEIIFISEKATEIVTGDKSFKGKLVGKLIAAGKTKEILIPFEGQITDNYLISVKGKTDLKMSDFNITPPTAMLGTLKTGNEISVSFSVKLHPGS